MSNPILFLDIDGVLNKSDTYKFAPECVAQLNRICKETNCSVVISSSWRLSLSLDDIRGIFRYDGVECNVVDETPSVSNRDGRYDEVQAWLDDSEEYNKHKPNFAIIDDIDIVGHFTDKWFVTNEYIGLTKEIADKVIKHLKERND